MQIIQSKYEYQKFYTDSSNNALMSQKRFQICSKCIISKKILKGFEYINYTRTNLIIKFQAVNVSIFKSVQFSKSEFL